MASVMGSYSSLGSQILCQGCQYVPEMPCGASTGRSLCCQWPLSWELTSSEAYIALESHTQSLVQPSRSIGSGACLGPHLLYVRLGGGGHSNILLNSFTGPALAGPWLLQALSEPSSANMLSGLTETL